MPATLRAAAPVALVLVLGAGVRLAAYRAIADGPLLYLHHWTETDMAFFDRWATAIAAGDVLTAESMRPYHSGHAAIARDAHAMSGSAAPFDEAVGRRIWNGWLGEKTFYQDPLHPYLLAFVYRVAPGHVGAVVLVQALLGLATAALAWLVARRLFDPTVAVVAGAMTAPFGPLVFEETLLLRTVLVAFTGTSALAAFLGALSPRASVARAGLAGFVGGLAFLANSSAALFGLAATAALVWARRAEPARARRTLAGVAAGFALAASPLVARNLAVGAPPFGVAAGGTLVFVNHNCADVSPEGGDTVSVHTAEILLRTGGRFLPAAVAAIRTHASVAAWLRMLARKFLAFWSWYEMPNNANYHYYRARAPAVRRLAVEFAVLGPLAAAGLVLAARRSTAYVVVLAYLAAGIATTTVFFVLSRFRVPLVPAMAAFAAFALVTLVRAAATRRPARAVLAAGLVVGAGAWVWRPLPPGQPILRVADVAVPNELAAGFARELAAAGDLPSASRLVAWQLATEPPELVALDPAAGASPLPIFVAPVAGSFVSLHEVAATVTTAAGDAGSAAWHRRHATILRTVAAQFDAQARSGGVTRAIQSR